MKCFHSYLIYNFDVTQHDAQYPNGKYSKLNSCRGRVVNFYAGKKRPYHIYGHAQGPATAPKFIMPPFNTDFRVE